MSMLDALLCSTLGTDERLKNQILRSHEYKYIEKNNLF